MTSNPLKPYIAGVAAYRYPGLGESLPPGGAKVLLLTHGGICITGAWPGDGSCLAWSPLPSRGEFHCPAPGERVPSGDKLLLTIGGICVFGPWSADGRYLGWADKPLRDRAKEGVLLAHYRPAELLADPDPRQLQ